jgi:type IV secretory pathway VirJ component
MLGKVAAERLINQEKLNKQLSQESKELKRNFALAQSANLDLEKKVAELAEALKRCQDEKKIVDEALEQSKKDLEKLQRTHDDDLSLIDNLRKTHDRSSKIVEDLQANNADLARSLCWGVTRKIRMTTLTRKSSKHVQVQSESTKRL